MTRKRLLAATMLALTFAIIPIKRDSQAAFGLEVSTAECTADGCGHWNPLLDCFCPDIWIPNYLPMCADAD